MLLIEGGEIQGEQGSNRSQTPLHAPCLINLTWEICNVCWSWLVLFPGQRSGVLGASYPDLGSLKLAMGGSTQACTVPLLPNLYLRQNFYNKVRNRMTKNNRIMQLILTSWSQNTDIRPRHQKLEIHDAHLGSFAKYSL